MRIYLFIFTMLFAVYSFGQSEPSISNIEWKIVSIKDHPIEDSIKLSISFGSIVENQPARVSGFSGCNRFSGQAVLGKKDEETTLLGFTQLMSTKMACIKTESAKIEKEFLETLPYVYKYMFKGNKLYFQTVDHKIVMVLIKKDK